jgi:uncharacterized protein
VRPSLEELLQLLDLKPLPEEGGFFVETYRSQEIIDAGVFGHGHTGKRSLSTAIYYLITPDSFSTLHKVPGEEIFHFYFGDPVEMLQLRANGSMQLITLGHDLRSGMKLQHVVSGGDWQGARLVTGGAYALLGTTMAPGFDYADFTKGRRDDLTATYPSHRELISRFTHS